MAMREMLVFFFAIITQAHLLFDINKNLDDLYPTYKLIEDTIKNDPKLIFKIKKSFFPAMNYRYWQVDGAEVVPISACMALHPDTEQDLRAQCNITGKFGEKLVEKPTPASDCWKFHWTNSLLMNLIPGDMLLAMDPILTSLIYSDIVRSLHTRGLTLILTVNITSSPTICHEPVDVVEQSFALYLTSVSVFISLIQGAPWAGELP